MERWESLKQNKFGDYLLRHWSEEGISFIVEVFGRSGGAERGPSEVGGEDTELCPNWDNFRYNLWRKN